MRASLHQLRIAAVLAILTTMSVALTAGASASSGPIQNTMLSAGVHSGKTVGVRNARALRSSFKRPRRRGVPGQVLFAAARLEDFAGGQSAPGAVGDVPDPAGSGKTVLKMTVADTDVAPITPTDNPRAQVGSDEFVEPGDELWWHASFYLPTDFPSFVPGWLTVMEGPYGPPFGGPPPLSVDVDEGAIRWQRNPTYDNDIPWSIPMIRGKWVDVLMHLRFGSDGWVETWIDGQQITFFGPSSNSYNPNHEAPTTHLDMHTMDVSNDGGPNFFVLQNYRMRGMFDSVTLYHGETKVGTTRASVLG